jgi:hypothetical protein
MSAIDNRGAPRNRLLYEQGQALRGEILSLLLTHSPLAAPLTAKRIQSQLTRTPLPSLRTIQWHVHAIRSPPTAAAE